MIGERGWRVRSASRASTTAGSITDPFDHCSHGADEFVNVAEAVLEQVGQAAGAVVQQRVGVFGVGVPGEHHDADRGVFGADPVGGSDALHVVCGRHADVGDRGIRGKAPDGVEEVAFGPGAWENELPPEIRAIFTHDAPTFLDGAPRP